MTDTQFRDEQHGARESYDKPCPEPKELEQILVRESDADTSEQLPIKTTYSQGQHKKQMDEIFSSNKLKPSTPFTTGGNRSIRKERSNSNLDKTKSHSGISYDQNNP